MTDMCMLLPTRDGNVLNAFNGFTYTDDAFCDLIDPSNVTFQNTRVSFKDDHEDQIDGQYEFVNHLGLSYKRVKIAATGHCYIIHDDSSIMDKLRESFHLLARLMDNNVLEGYKHATTPHKYIIDMDEVCANNITSLDTFYHCIVQDGSGGF